MYYSCFRKRTHVVVQKISFDYSLLSIFIPNPNDNISVAPTAEIVTLTLVLPITQNTSYVLSLNDNYFNSIQRNILKACVSKFYTNKIIFSFDLVTSTIKFGRYNKIHDSALDR
jgi:hypothetical protein